jgi:hypothetical protein
MRPQEFIDFVKIIESDASAMAKVIKALISYNSQCFAAISKLNAKFLEIKKEHTQSRKVPARSRAKGRK